MRHQALLFIDWKRGWSLLHLGGFFGVGFLAAFFAAGFLAAFLPLEVGFLSDAFFAAGFLVVGASVMLASVGAAGFCGILCWTVLGAAGF